MDYLEDFKESMFLIGHKKVSKTDISKGAYVPNKEQRQVMSAAGYDPVPHEDERMIGIVVGTTGDVLETTYYSSLREGSGRTAEIRMGRALVHWINEGDELFIGTDGDSIFVYRPGDCKMDKIEDIDQTPVAVLYRNLSTMALIERAIAVGNKTRKKPTQNSRFERDPIIREFARRRSRCKCEMPGCRYLGFEKLDGNRFIEVHHVAPLGKGGGDIIYNVAALCANCHREAHYGKNSSLIQEKLEKAVKLATDEFLSK